MDHSFLTNFPRQSMHIEKIYVLLIRFSLYHLLIKWIICRVLINSVHNVTTNASRKLVFIYKRTHHHHPPHPQTNTPPPLSARPSMLALNYTSVEKAVIEIPLSDTWRLYRTTDTSVWKGIYNEVVWSYFLCYDHCIFRMLACIHVSLVFCL